MLPTLFIPHGGGPLPLLGDPGHTGMVKFLKALPAKVQPKPKAILLVSAHWEVCVRAKLFHMSHVLALQLNTPD